MSIGNIRNPTANGSYRRASTVSVLCLRAIPSRSGPGDAGGPARPGRGRNPVLADRGAGEPESLGPDPQGADRGMASPPETAERAA